MPEARFFQEVNQKVLLYSFGNENEFIFNTRYEFVKVNTGLVSTHQSKKCPNFNFLCTFHTSFNTQKSLDIMATHGSTLVRYT